MKTTHALALALMTILPAARAFAADAVSDADIESAARNSYVFRHYLNHDRVKVNSDRGDVELSGTVSEESHKSLAEATVASLDGVRNVNNQLKVKNKEPAKRSDAWITAKVKASLLYHSSVSGTSTHVETHNGVVTLRGKADSEAEKKLAGRYARDIDGVKDVNNKMTAPSEAKTTAQKAKVEMDDASITAQAKVALLTHRSTSAVNTHIETRLGVVTVTGQASSMAEKDLVTELVQDIDGVKGVDNKMTY